MPARRSAGLLLAALLAVAFVAPAAAERRVALVIGNDAYSTIPPLQKAINDARAIADRLRSLGFEVIARENVDRRGMNQALDEFTARLSGAEAGLFFFAGHGVQFEGRNILLPVDIPLPRSEASLIDEGIALGRILERISETRVRFSALIIDACRNNPFPKQGTRSIGGARGLAVPAAPNGVYIAYSAGANEEALDGLGPDDTNPNSVFTRNLLPVLGAPGMSFDDMVKTARQRVREQAARIGHQQNPAIYDQTTGDFYFLGPTTVTVTPPAGAVAAQPVDKETIFWEGIKDSRNPAAFEAYLRQYPEGAFAELARFRISTLSAPPPAAPAQPAPAQPAPAPSPAPAAASTALAPAAIDEAAVVTAVQKFYREQSAYEDNRLIRSILLVRNFDVLRQSGDEVDVRIRFDAEPLFLNRHRRYDVIRATRTFRLRRGPEGYVVVERR